jgi:hypothetical protein
MALSGRWGRLPFPGDAGGELAMAGKGGARGGGTSYLGKEALRVMAMQPAKRRLSSRMQNSTRGFMSNRPAEGKLDRSQPHAVPEIVLGKSNRCCRAGILGGFGFLGCLFEC